MWHVFSRIILILMLLSLTAKAQDGLFNKNNSNYKAWQYAKARMIKNGKYGIRREITSAAEYVKIPSKILLAVCFVESSHRDLSSIQDGNSQSYGVCQVKLETAELMDRVYNLVPVTEEALQDVWVNAYYAAKYLQWQYKRYGSWQKAIDAYNKGRLVSENSQYVNKVLIAMKGEK